LVTRNLRRPQKTAFEKAIEYSFGRKTAPSQHHFVSAPRAQSAIKASGKRRFIPCFPGQEFVIETPIGAIKCKHTLRDKSQVNKRYISIASWQKIGSGCFAIEFKSRFETKSLQS
jgi:hypothetical protein